MADSPQDYVKKQLKNAHSLEQMSLQMTQAAAKAADDPALRQLFDHHHQETEEHERLIRERLEAHGESPSMIQDVGARVAAIAKGTSAMLPDDTPGRLVRDGYVQEQTEIASYELLRRVADRAGDTQTAQVASRILQDERHTADELAANFDHAAELSLRAAVAG
jgi:ferritin-like metal-binding protein YciE